MRNSFVSGAISRNQPQLKLTVNPACLVCVSLGDTGKKMFSKRLIYLIVNFSLKSLILSKVARLRLQYKPTLQHWLGHHSYLRLSEGVCATPYRLVCHGLFFKWPLPESRSTWKTTNHWCNYTRGKKLLLCKIKAHAQILSFLCGAQQK